MFEGAAPRIFGLPPGADFPGAFAAGLLERFGAGPPENLTRVEVFLNSGRMRREVRDALSLGGARLLPRLKLVVEAGLDPAPDLVPLPVPPLRRRLILAQLVARLIERQPDIAPRAALFDLADSLAELMEEMQGEGVDPAVVAALDVARHSAHWARTQEFLKIVLPFFSGDAPDAPARQRIAVTRLAARWAIAPPDHPVIVAGSTGSRGTTSLLMQAVARLPQGALILPGFDTDMPTWVWESLGDAMTAEDQPQYRFRALLDLLGTEPREVRTWTVQSRHNPSLNKLISLSLRPAPVTDQWLVEGPDLPDLVEATRGISLIEAPEPGIEAMAIALILRRGVEEGRAVALVTPDRMLTRRVTAALDRWGIIPDDSAGLPLGLSPPGRLLRHVARQFGRVLTAEGLLVLLKHPLVAAGSGRGDHLRWTRDLELTLRRKGPAFPTGETILTWATEQKGDGVVEWARWLSMALDGVAGAGTRPLADHVAQHLTVVTSLAQGPNGDGAQFLRSGEAGTAALAVLDEMLAEAAYGGSPTTADYADLVDALLAREEVRDAVTPHPLVKILGPREARECRADLIVLGGLNDGSWPQSPPPDPWLNRAMRQAAGLLLPERQIGLSAHDYQQAVAAPEVIVSRSVRDAESETVPSRWLNRLQNLMSGLPQRHGPEALAAMRARGQVWLDWATAIDRPEERVPPARRPAPRPPVDVRPTELAVTGIRTLIRDPYAIYARHILKLRPLAPLRAEPDALARGSALHRILEAFIRERPPREPDDAALLRLLAIADTVLAEDAPWPAARMLWRARLERAAAGFLSRERESGGRPVFIEQKGGVDLPGIGFRLTAKPDRIDEMPDGRLHILDYKTGAPPTAKQQKAFDKQLLLEAAMAERGAFRELGPREVARITYVGLNAAAKVETTEITPALTGEVWEGLIRLVARYMTHSQGYVARRAVFDLRTPGDYDHLARFGEWEMKDTPHPENVG
jgi:double-strand break repair protein AddB